MKRKKKESLTMNLKVCRMLKKRKSKKKTLSLKSLKLHLRQFKNLKLKILRMRRNKVNICFWRDYLSL
jgi:hypothetical protein